jgi:hypothetical protein
MYEAVEYRGDSRDCQLVPIIITLPKPHGAGNERMNHRYDEKLGGRSGVG